MNQRIKLAFRRWLAAALFAALRFDVSPSQSDDKPAPTAPGTWALSPLRAHSFSSRDGVVANASGSHVMAPQEVLRLSPQPSFIQYQ